MTTTRQGVKFAHQNSPETVAFIDAGRLIKVYSQEDASLLAALRLAQAKRDGVKINGTDDYKRKCDEIAAKNYIRVVNPELSGIMKEFERKAQPPMSIDAARKAIEAETRRQEARHWNMWGSYNAHKKEIETLVAKEPEEPKFLGVKKWRAEHAAWESERDRLLEVIRSDIEYLGVQRALDGADMSEAHRKAAMRHERLKEYAAEEALRLHPSAAAVIHEDDARREAEEAKAREEKEINRRFYAAILELAGRFNKEVSFVTNAQDGRNYSGLMLGAVERNGHYYAAQIGYDGHVFLHDIKKDDLLAIAAWAGKKADIVSSEGRIGTIAEECKRRERNRGWSR